MTQRIWLFADYNQAESRVVAWKGPVPKLRQWYSEGVDVHSYVCRQIAKVIQEQKLPMPTVGGRHLFYSKPYLEFGKGDEEREISKRIVHGSNYGMGIPKLALILGVTEQVAKLLSGIYFTLFPEVKTKYQAWIEKELRRSRTLWMPEPVRFRKVFWDILTDDTFRDAYATYPQSTIGAMLNRTIHQATHLFLWDEHEKLKEQWCAWYGREHYDTWRRLRDRDIRTPQAILWSGMDVRLNVHDAGGISIPDDSDLVRWAAKTWKELAEVPIYINPDDRNDYVVIPVDFKKGPTWGNLEDYKLAA